MSNIKYTALILGSTGLIGQDTIHLLLNNNKYDRVYAVTRRELGIAHSKLIPIKADFHNIDLYLKDIAVDHMFCCIGTTKSKTPNLDEYYQIDLEYPIKVASILHDKGCQTICLVSSIGANADSKNFYLQLKGKVEKALKNIGYKSVHIFRPSLLRGKRNEFRLLERIIQPIYPFIDLLLQGKFMDYRSINSKDVASAMVNVALKNNFGYHIYQTQQIKELA